MVSAGKRCAAISSRLAASLGRPSFSSSSACATRPAKSSRATSSGSPLRMPTPPAWAYTSSPPSLPVSRTERTATTPRPADANRILLRAVARLRNASASSSSPPTATARFRVRSPHSWCARTAPAAPGTASTATCASSPDCAATTVATVASRIKLAAAGPAKAARPVREIQRKRTPTAKRPMAKWMTIGW